MTEECTGVVEFSCACPNFPCPLIVVTEAVDLAPTMIGTLSYNYAVLAVQYCYGSYFHV